MAAMSKDQIERRRRLLRGVTSVTRAPREQPRMVCADAQPQAQSTKGLRLVSAFASELGLGAASASRRTDTAYTIIFESFIHICLVAVLCSLLRFSYHVSRCLP
jgi:hypothetical protein